MLVCAAIALLVASRGLMGARLHDVDTIYYRLAIWGAGLRMIPAHPLFGIGFFNFAKAMSGVQQGFGSLLPSYREVEGDASHNTLITVVVEFGILGLVLCSAAFVKITQNARKRAAQLWGQPGAAWVLALVIVYLVSAQFISSFEGTTNTLLLAILGVMAGLRNKRLELP